jgi:hypothetical protein
MRSNVIEFAWLRLELPVSREEPGAD